VIVELHMLQNFAPSCLNRDDTNSPKECQFGGYRRARISSQCIKRAIRWNGVFKDMLKDHLSSRSLRFPTQVYDELLKLGVKQSLAKEIGKHLETIAKKEATKSEGEEGKETEKIAKKNQASYELDIFKTPQMVFYTEDEVKECATQVKALLDQGMKPAEVFKKDKKGKFTNLTVFPVPRSADIGLFGRMVTSAHFDNIDAACQVAHAISTNKVGVEFDFYTAVDDLQPKEETGAGMMGTIEFNSACYYRYANIDLVQLKKNLGGDEALSYKAVEAFLRASVNAIPSGKQTSMASPTPPDFILAVVRDSGAWSLANAFAKPVSPGSNGNLVEHSITALVDYWNRLVKVYGDKGVRAKPALALVKAELTGLNPVENMDRMIKEVMKAVTSGSQKGG
jgi:CRISPR system Cascade subunit CasC